jgi:hypothetical protein
VLSKRIWAILTHGVLSVGKAAPALFQHRISLVVLAGHHGGIDVGHGGGHGLLRRPGAGAGASPVLAQPDSIACTARRRRRQGAASCGSISSGSPGLKTDAIIGAVFLERVAQGQQVFGEKFCLAERAVLVRHQ